MARQFPLFICSLALCLLAARAAEAQQSVAQNSNGAATKAEAPREDPVARLEAGKQAAREGKYAEALAQYVWYHDHALEYVPGLYGVRLSFALADWMELAGQYPPARAALKTIRDEKTKRLMGGEKDWHLFNDVQNINRVLGNEEATYDLVLALHQSDPAFGLRCADTARDALMKANDYRLARSAMGDPIKEINRRARMLEISLPMARGQADPEIAKRLADGDVDIYVNNVSQLLDIVRQSKSGDDVPTLVNRAIAVVSDPEAQEAVRKKLVSYITTCNPQCGGQG